jgi:hypothetical protein
MDDNNNNNTNTTPPAPAPSTTNADKNHDGDGVKAPKKRGRPSIKKSSLLAEEMSSPPQKKPSIEVNKGMEVCDLG